MQAGKSREEKFVSGGKKVIAGGQPGAVSGTLGRNVGGDLIILSGSLDLAKERMRLKIKELREAFERTRRWGSPRRE